jgi:hypothetical protein
VAPVHSRIPWIGTGLDGSTALTRGARRNRVGVATIASGRRPRPQIDDSGETTAV